MKKKIIAFLLILTLAVCCVQALAIDLYVDGNKLEPDSPPVIVSDRTLVPLRSIFEALGADVSWDAPTRTATAVKGWIHVVITIDEATAYVNGAPQTLDVPAQIVSGRTMVPVRFVSEALNAKVTWLPEKQSVYVNTAVPADAEVDPSLLPAPEPATVSHSSSSSSSSSSYSSDTDDWYDDDGTTYVLNTNTKKFHYPWCSSAARIKSHNRKEVTWSRSEIISKGYSPCKNCDP